MAPERLEKRRLGVAPRVGIVLTTLWLIGAPLGLQFDAAQDRAAIRQAGLDLCQRHAGDDPRKRYECLNAYLDLPDGWPLSWPEVLLTAFVVAALAWVLAYIVVWTVRWVLAGRHTEK